MILNRRNLFQGAFGGAAATLMLNGRALADEDKPNPRGNHFCLYIHFGSHCGISTGLVQPMKAGAWPIGFFRSGAQENALNTNLNKHTAHKSLVFHDYIKFLTEIGDDMCLVNGYPRSLDHTQARMYQMRGVPAAAFAPEWSMGFAQNMITEARKNPLVLSRDAKTMSVADVTTLGVGSIADFRTVTRDAPEVTGKSADEIWNGLKDRFAKYKSTTVKIDANLSQNVNYQLNTLLNGMPELEAIKADIDALDKLMSFDEVAKIIDKNPDAPSVRQTLKNSENTRNLLVLAGAMAKSGLASGMTMGINDADLHTGGGDLLSPRTGAAAWAQIMTLWKWIKSMGLDNDVMIIVGQEFARGPYNGSFSEGVFKNAQGQDVTIKAYGRDHGVSMGMMFLHAKVPSGGRIGTVHNNLVPLAGKDAAGTFIQDSTGYFSENIVGSMYMRLFDDIFPTERMVRKHWPTFVPIDPILNAK